MSLPREGPGIFFTGGWGALKHSFVLSRLCLLEKHLLFFFSPQPWDLRKCPYRATNTQFKESLEGNSACIQPDLSRVLSTASLANGPWALGEGSPLLPWEWVGNSTAGCSHHDHNVTCFLFSTNLTLCKILRVVKSNLQTLHEELAGSLFHPSPSATSTKLAPCIL